jgi:hypothetical protein
MKGCDHGDRNLERGKKMEKEKDIYRLDEKTLPGQFRSAGISAKLSTDCMNMT